MINLGLQRITRLLEHISKKYLQQTHFVPPWKAVHIAGTNGKGSVAAYLSALLNRQVDRDSARPLRVGRFTSPHFIDRWDCIQINDQPVAKDVFLRTEEDVKALAARVHEELRAEAHEEVSSTTQYREQLSAEQIEKDAKPTEFEILTATAFAIFSQPGPITCDIAVIECGLGGRLDATNALPDSAIAVSVITSIGLDHVDILGGSLESIIREKCGIVRSDVPVVVDSNRYEELKKAIQERFPNKIVGSADFNLPVLQRDTVVEQLGEEHYQSSLLDMMPHQERNLSLAFRTMDYLAELGMVSYVAPNGKDKQALCVEVLQDASRSYPARLQLLRPGWYITRIGAQGLPLLGNTTVLLDGAHNAQSAEALRTYVDKEFFASDCRNVLRGRREIWIVALSSTKPPKEMLQTFFQRQVSGSGYKDRNPTAYPQLQPETTKIILTSFGQVDGMPWVKPASTKVLHQCADELGLSSKVEAITGNIIEALEAVEKLLATCRKRGHEAVEGKPIVVIAGSLYLCSDFLRFIRDGQEEFLKQFEHGPDT